MALRVGSITVLQRPAVAVDSPPAKYGGLHPSSTVLPAGHVKAHGHRPLPVDTIYDRDQVVTMRDGAKLRVDYFRPTGDEKVPALLAWSPYGKTGTGFYDLNLVPGRVGVKEGKLSDYEKFEAPDPAEWVQRGYTIANIDARGAFDSEGDIRWFGTAEGRDGHDAIEEIAKLPWCNGKVAMVGNSWLAMAQWLTAAERPPHLACIAPFEGSSDVYRETLCRGGVPYTPFWGFLAATLYGRNQQEDVVAMLEKYPYMNEYWEDKRAKIENIEVPAYVLASYSTGLHTLGTLRGYEDLKHEEKWLCIHSTQEWHDLYGKERVDDLQKFLDFYTKGIKNDWPSTPRARVSILDFNQNPIINYPFPAWPIPSTTYQTLYLHPNNSLFPTAYPTPSSASYQADIPALQMDADSEEVCFEYTIPARSYVVGYPKAILNMSCAEHNDLDVFVQIRKATPSDEVLRNLNIPMADLGVSSPSDVVLVNTNFYLGANGVLRASRRAVDEKRSKPHWNVQKHTKEAEAMVEPGSVVEMDIGMWPTGMVFEKGEKLVLKIAGHNMVLAEFEPLRGAFASGNKGRHVIHYGGDKESRVIIPLVEL
ncbi:hypothetical protein LTR62_001675 [Meristemomyces frigidus]|uniref:Xaa-Pro dipeptidyl-peptidase C-terminal domain-containing protein n=1 Tax=Meristemomyces frigidus TaxID=1508187 RepID=A0AAN7T882_9PEZI|nr:hypothetical protein LTR62_001675 [Meristemomyces frigidus]